MAILYQKGQSQLASSRLTLQGQVIRGFTALILFLWSLALTYASCPVA